MCLEGSCTLEDDNHNKATIEQGESILIPAIIDNISITPICETKLLQTYVE